MKKYVLSLLALSAAIVTVFTVSCKKVQEEVENTTTTAEDISRTEAQLASVFNVLDDVASSDGRLSKTGSVLLPAGVELKFTDSTMDGDGVKYFLDFGPLPGILCNDGVTRSGRIDVHQTKRFSEVGCVVDVNIEEANAFHVSTTGGMTKISGMANITRLGTDKIQLKINNGKAENASDFGSITFSSDKIITHKELGAPGVAEDEYLGAGTGSGTNSKGKPYTWKTTTDVKKVEKPNCSFPIEGVIELTSESSTYQIDFAPDNSDCDQKVVMTLPNGTKVIKDFKK